MKPLLCAFASLCLVVFAGCFGLENVTKDDVRNVADCYEETVVGDDHYAVVLNKDCIDLAILSTPLPTETESEDDVVEDSTPVVLPADATWELVATLQRNPLAPWQFYIFPEQQESMIEAYLAGKHFIFEIGGEFTDPVGRRHYIIQPYIPFQDKHKNPGVVDRQKKSGVKIDSHFYGFLSEGWYVPVDFTGGYGTFPGSVGLGVEFSVSRNLQDEILTYGVRIGLLDDNLIQIDSTHSYISHSTRLRVYVSD